jgi:hypothetical protein
VAVEDIQAVAIRVAADIRAAVVVAAAIRAGASVIPEVVSGIQGRVGGRAVADSIHLRAEGSAAAGIPDKAGAPGATRMRRNRLR